MALRLGCTGWGYEDWRGNFYPRTAEPSEYLTRYARVFDFTEIDSSYYALPTVEQSERWARATPEGFLFSAKLPRALTADARLRDPEPHIEEILESFGPLARAGKLGPLVAQCPPTLKAERDADALQAFLRAWPARWPLVVELRHASWWNERTYAMLRDAGVGLVWSVTQFGRTPPILTTDAVYLRLVGDRALTRFDAIQRDHAPEMRRWKEEIERHARDSDERYLVVNNHFMGHAPTTALIASRVFGHPEPDLGAASREPGQRSLTGW